MSLFAGARLGPYEIHSLIGAGGMGEVYKARDTRLDRTVAVKLLPADLAERSDRRRRFEAEARAISALNHPHICTLFDVGEQDGRAFLVMEHLEGETLDDRLVRGALPAADVVRYAIQIASALDHAHRERIVHRDLKPSNVMLTASGAKLLDFGLARRPAVEPAGTMSTLSFDQRKLTAEGTILGTFQYMSPEQLEGKDADARTDIFAFGTLIFEMATGRKAFEGASQASLIASILTAQPPAISSAQGVKGLPAALDHVVERCLAKNPDDRWQTARDVKLELDWIAAGSSQASRLAAPVRLHRRERLAWGVALVGVAAAVAVAIAAFFGGRGSPSREVTRFVVAPPAGTTITSVIENSTAIALSPDGRFLAFAAMTEGRQQLWVRPFESAVARLLDGTDDAISPFWSPDSRFIGFFAPGSGELKKIDASGGPARTICAAPQLQAAATWGRDGTILFTQLGQGLFRVPADGGTPVRVTSLDASRRELNHFWPEFLPDGRHVLYLATSLDAKGERDTPTVYVASLDSPDRTPLAKMHSRMMYASPGYLVFVQDGALMAQAFDAATVKLSGDPVRIAERVAYFKTIGTGGFTISSNGVLAHHGGGDPFRLVWHDRHGNTTDSGWPPQLYGAFRISRDGERVAVDVVDPRSGLADLWIYDVVRGTPVRFTTDPTGASAPVWSGDGRTVLFRSPRRSAPSLFTKTFDGTEQPLFPGDSPLSAMPMGPMDWSADGRWIAYIRNSPQTLRDLWLLPVTGDRTPRPISVTRFDEHDAQFSPDSTAIAYVSNESGRPEVYVAPFDRPGDKRPISVGGGTTPRWRKDGRELYYASAGNRGIMAVDIEPGATIKPGVPRRLFSLGIELATRPTPRNAAYDAAPDGQRFLVSVPAGEPMSSRITVVQNWNALMKNP
jgi:Tol biopolymer transport system component